MPFDGIVTKCIVQELNNLLLGGRIEKIYQPETDEVFFQIRSLGQNYRLVLSASANYPRIHLTDVSKENPVAPPVFCMLLRKHLAGGRFTGFEFHDYERIITLKVESTNELGDLSEKKLHIEIMGRHSNLILTNSENRIIDAIKHVDQEISSVREIMPAREYVFPPKQDKVTPDELNLTEFIQDIRNPGEVPGTGIGKHLLNSIKGFSPLLCSEICFRAGLDEKISISGLDDMAIDRLEKELGSLLQAIREGIFSPCLVYNDDKDTIPADFHCIPLRYKRSEISASMNAVLDEYYSSKDKSERLKQKRADLSKVLNNSLDRCNKKLALQQDKLREVSDREVKKLFGELITANIYCIPQGAKTVRLQNYYSENNETIDIPLDENLTPQQNAQRYFKQYTKGKSTYLYTSQQVESSLKELEYLESVQQLLENCVTLQEIDEVRQELFEQGYISSRRKGNAKKPAKLSEPLHFRSSDGLDIFVGKNNKQNDILTLKTASSNDIWLHTRNIPGSHVVIRKTQQNIPDSTLLEAAILAAYHSKAKASSNVPVDYTQVKNVKKPSGAKPGMVIYNEFKTLIVTPDEAVVDKLRVKK